MAFVTVTPEVIHCPRGSVSEWWEYFWCSKFCLLTSEHLGPHFNTLRYIQPDNESSRCNHLLDQLERSRVFLHLVLLSWLQICGKFPQILHSQLLRREITLTLIMPLVSKSVQPHCTPDFPALWRSSIFNWFHWLVKDTRTLYTVGMDTYRRYSIGPINIRNKRFLVNFQLKTCDINELKPIFCLYSFTFDFLQLNWAARCLLFDPLQKNLISMFSLPPVLSMVPVLTICV